MHRTPQLELAFTAIITLAPRIDVGNTPNGRRVSFPITGGSFEGPKVPGKVMPGSQDWALFIPSKGYSVHAEYKLQEDNSTIIHILSVGNFFAEGSMAVPFCFTSPSFEVPFGNRGWLYDGACIGTLEPQSDELVSVEIAVYKAV